MPALIDARPPGANVLFLPGNTLTVTFTWPDGSLSGRSFTAELDGTALDLSIVGDVMTVAATAVETAAVTASAAFVLTETTTGTDVVIAGTWTPDTGPSASANHEVTVNESSGEVTVTAQSIPTAVGTLTATGDLTVGGEILTGSLAGGNTFGGIEREGRVFPAGELLSPSGQINFGDGLPRVNCPDGITTDVYAVFEIEEWWLQKPDGTDGTIGIYFEWVNDHTGTGDVRWDCAVRQYKIGQTAVASGIVLATRTFTQSSPAADVGTTGVVASIANGNQVELGDPGPLASYYSLRISRLGGDAADTLLGPVGIVAANMTRGQ